MVEREKREDSEREQRKGNCVNNLKRIKCYEVLYA